VLASESVRALEEQLMDPLSSQDVKVIPWGTAGSGKADRESSWSWGSSSHPYGSWRLLNQFSPHVQSCVHNLRSKTSAQLQFYKSSLHISCSERAAHPGSLLAL